MLNTNQQVVASTMGRAKAVANLIVGVCFATISGLTHATIGAGYQALANNQLAEAEAHFDNAVNERKEQCLVESNDHTSCLKLALAAAGMGETLIQLDAITDAYPYFTLAYQSLSSAEQRYIAANNLQQKLPAGSRQIPAAHADQYQQQVASAKKQLDEKLSGLDIDALIEEKMGDSDLPPEAQRAMMQAIKKMTAQNKGKLNSDVLYPIKIQTEDYAGTLAPTLAMASKLICDSGGSGPPKSGSAAEFLAGLAVNQQKYLQDSRTRVSISRQIDEADNIAITDAIQIDFISSLIPFIEASHSYQPNRSEQTDNFYEALTNCIASARQLLELGISKALTYGYNDLKTLAAMQQLAATPGANLKPKLVQQLTFNYGLQLLLTGQIESGRQLMEPSLERLHGNLAPQDVKDETFVSRLKPLLNYSRALCPQPKKCKNTIKDVVTSHLQAILADQQQLLKGKAAMVEMAKQGMVNSPEGAALLSQVRGGFTIGFGIHAEQRTIYSIRLAELVAAEILLSINDLQNSRRYLDEGASAHLPDSIYAPTIMAYDYYIRAKLAGLRDEITTAGEYWQKAIAQYNETLPLNDILFGVPQLYRSPTAPYEEAAQFFIDQKQVSTAIELLEQARQHSIAGKRLPDYVSPSYLAEQRQRLLSDYDKLVVAGAGGDQQLIDKFLYDPSAPGTTIPGPSDIFYIADHLSFLPELKKSDALAFINRLNTYDGFKGYRNLQHALVANSRLPEQPRAREQLTLKQVAQQLAPNQQILASWQNAETFFIYSIANNHIVASYSNIAQASTSQLLQLIAEFAKGSIAADKSHLILMNNASLTQQPLAKLLPRYQVVDVNTSITFTPSLDAFINNDSPQLSTKRATMVTPAVRGSVYIDSRKELESLKLLMPTTELAGKKANRQQLKNEIANSAIVHVASHAQLNPVNPEFSYIAINDGQGGGDKLFNHELGQLPFSNVSLVMLNACQTSALSPYFLHNEFSSLQGSVISAGAGAVIASIQPVEDQIAARFSAVLYQELRTGTALATAFFNAQQALKTEFPTSDQWAFYTLSSTQATLNTTFSPKEHSNQAINRL